MSTPTQAAIYTRISDDAEGLEQGVGRQRADCLSLAASLGLEVHPDHIFTDNDRGASDLSKKDRPEYRKMLALAEAGKVQHVLAYSNSRLTRRPREFEDLIQLHLRRGVEYHTVVSGKDDLSTADGRMVARIKADIDAGEAERTGERVRRARLESARQGNTWRGQRAFGWREGNEALEPVEAALIRKAADEVIAGRAINAIAREWNQAGVTTARGNQWSPAQLGQMLKSPRLAGWRIHQGKVALDLDGMPVRGRWEPVLDDDTFDRLQAARSADKRSRVPRRGSRAYLLSGIARCGVCSGPMAGQRISEEAHNYFCAANPATRDHTNTASGRAVDRIVSARVILGANRAPLEEVPRVFEGQARLDEVKEDLREVMRKLREGSNVPKQMLWAQAEALGVEEQELQRGRAEWLDATSGPAPVELSAESWKAMPLDERQAHVEAVLGTVIIQPPKVRRPGSRFDPARVQVV